MDTDNHSQSDNEFIDIKNISSDINNSIDEFLFQENDSKEFIDIKNGDNFTKTISSNANICDSPVSVFDAACYVLKKLKGHSCSTMKLHKLLYYCQAWSMVWEEKPLFNEKIEAWVNGPVIKELFNFHRGLYEINYDSFSEGNDDELSKTQKEDVDIVLQSYGNKSPQWLIDCTHSEEPWINARKGLEFNERGNREITLEEMQQFYSSL